LTDMQDNPGDKLVKIISEAYLKEDIFTIIVGVGMGLNCDLADVVSKGRGSTIIPATKREHIDKLYSEFDFTFFPAAYNVTLEFKSNDFIVEKSIGTRSKKVTEIEEEKSEWRTSSHHLNDKLFKDKINFLLLYFNRLKRRFPKPVMAKVSDFLRYNKKTLAEINTVFPGITKFDKDNNLFVEGGQILLKLKDNKITESHVKSGCIIVKYNDISGKCFEDAFHFNIDLFASVHDDNGNYFKGAHIKRGMCLYYYGKFLRRLMKIKNKEKTSFDNNYLKEAQLKLVKGRVEAFIEKYENDKFVKDDLLDKIKKLYNLVVEKTKRAKKKMIGKQDEISLQVKRILQIKKPKKVAKRRIKNNTNNNIAGNVACHTRSKTKKIHACNILPKTKSSKSKKKNNKSK